MSVTVEKDISKIINQLRSTSSAEVYKGLQDIRNKVLKSKTDTQAFKENKGIKHLLRFVKKTNEKILDIALSILANLCLEEDARVEVGECGGIVGQLIDLVAYMQKDSIVGRSCRLVGNLALSRTLAVKLHQKGAVSKLIDTIKSDDTSSVTKHMAVRALRILWEVDNFRLSMVNDQAVRTVSSLLTTKVDELLQAVLKALASFTHRCNERCALEVQGDGKGFEELVGSIKYCSKSELAVSVVLNLCFVPEVRPLLGTAGVVEAIIGLLSGLAPSQYSFDNISVLCLLCRDSVNRSKLRRGGGLEILLETLRCGLYSTLEARALNAILHFYFDEVGLQLLIREGLVPVLIQKLNKIVEEQGSLTSHPCQHKSDTSDSQPSSNQPKRPRISSTTSSRCPPERSQSCDVDCDPLGLRPKEPLSNLSPIDMHLSGHWSPGSSRSLELSPDSSRAFSPLPLLQSLSPTPSSLSPISQSPPPSPLSDAYSPVCRYSSSSSDDEKQDVSDTEGIAECDGESDSEVVSPCLNDKEDVQDIQEALNSSLPANASSRHNSMEWWCLLMLSRVSHMDTLVDDMVSSNTVDTLLRYYALVESPLPKASRVLQRLTRNHYYLLPLLRSGFVLKVNDRFMQRTHDDCFRCSDLDSLGRSLLSQLSLLAESGYGEGEIVYQLMRTTRPVQAVLIVSVPHVIKAKRLLRIMMNCKTSDQSGLDLLLQLMTDECGDDLVREAVESVSRLAHHLGVPARPSNKLTKRLKTCELCGFKKEKKHTESEASCDFIVLELDDGATVRAKRDDLCRESPVFSAMLTGGFSESGRQRVSLKDVSLEPLSALLQLMCTSGRCQCCLPQDDTDFCFEVLQLADRFMMHKVVEQVAKWLLARLAPDVAPALYLRAQDLRHVLSLSADISTDTLHFILATQVSREKRVEMFSIILKSDYKKQFIEDVNCLVKRYLDR